MWFYRKTRFSSNISSISYFHATDSTVCQGEEEKRAKENRFYSLCVWLDHDVAVDEDGADDRAGEEGVGEHVDGNPDDYHGYHDFDDAHLSYIRCNDDEDICIMIMI